MRRLSHVKLAFAALATSFALAAPAQAVTIVENPGEFSRLRVASEEASPGVSDDITVTHPSSSVLVVHNDNDLMACGSRLEVANCVQVDPNTVQVSGGWERIEVLTYFGDDVLDTRGVGLPATVFGGDGADTIMTGAGADRITGEAGNDVITPGGGNDDAVGDAGNDRFVAEPTTDGADAYAGRDGADVVDYTARAAALSITLDGVANDGAAGEGDNVFTSTETVRSGSGDDTITGSSAANTLDGGPGSDTLAGAGGNDNVAGGEGNDTLDEGASGNGADGLAGNGGIDTIDYSDRTNVLVITLYQEPAANDGEPLEHDEVYGSVENALGGLHNDRIFGNGARNVLIGGPGGGELHGGGNDDKLVAGDGIDQLWGDAGNDNMAGGGGMDVFHEETAPNGSDGIAGEAGNDHVSYAGRTANLTVAVDGIADDGEAGEHDNVFLSTERVTGGTGNDTLVGNSGPNSLYGGDGADTLTGGLGNDNLEGGGGNDVFREGAVPSGSDGIVGNAGFDTVDYGQRTTSLTVTMLDVADNDGAAGEHDLFYSSLEGLIGGSAADRLEGNDIANRIEGGAGDDTLRGLAGPDTIVDQNGDADALIDCGADADTVYADPADTLAGCETAIFPPPAPS